MSKVESRIFRPLRSQQIWFLAQFCWVFFVVAGGGWGQELAKEGLPRGEKKETFEYYYSLRALDPALRGKKTFEVTVVFPLPEKKGLVVTDGTENVFFKLSQGELRDDWKEGDRFRGSGLLLKNPYQITIVESKVTERLARDEKFKDPAAKLPSNPRRQTLRPYHLEQVLLEGRLLSAVQSAGRLRLQIQGAGFQYHAEGPAVNDDAILGNVGASVKIKGLFWYPIDGSTIDTLLDTPVVYFSDRNAMDTRGLSRKQMVRVSGKLIDIFGNGRAFLQEDGKVKLIELRIFFKASLLPPKGQRVDCWGHRAKMRNGKETFNVSSFRAVSSREDPSVGPVPELPLYRPGDQTQHLQRVTVLGHLNGDPSADLRQGFFNLLTAEGEDPIRVVLPNSDTLIDKQLMNARQLRVTGFLQLEGKAVELYPLYLHEIEVLGVTPWLKTVTICWLTLGAFGLIVGGLIWVTLLQRVVKHRTEALDDSLSLLNASYDAVYDGICVVDHSGEVRKTNLRFWEILGLQEESLEGLDGHELSVRIANCFQEPQEFLGLWKRLVDDEESRETGDLDLADSEDGELRFYSVPASPRKGQRQPVRVWVFADMTEQRRLEGSLLQSQKMEAVGRLAGGVAHDFNNLLTGILGNLDIASFDREARVAEIEGPLDSARQAAKRAAELIKSLLGFSRQEKLSSCPSCANAVVRQLTALVDPTLSPKITLRTELEENLHLAEFDPTKLEQVVLNMVVNARDELEGCGGDIVVTTQSVLASHPETGLPDRYIRVSIADNAGGMPESVRSRIFEPFFTTKEPGKGTGLGLATSYGIVQQMVGWIDCESQLGEGSTFHIYLPEVEGSLQPVSDDKRKTQRQPPQQLIRKELEILCVDDEPIVRSVAEGILAHSGFQVSSAEHGRAALDLLSRRTTKGEKLPDLIISDLTMPVMDGKELIKEVRATYPHLPVIICSGYLVNLSEFSKEAGTEFDGFIQKPYEPQGMIEKVESLLGESDTSLSV